LTKTVAYCLIFKNAISQKGDNMTTAVQSVIKNISQVTSKISKKVSMYVALIILTPERKNYASMAQSNKIAYEKVYIRNKAVGDYIDESSRFLLSLVKSRATDENQGYLIVDFTLLQKPYAEHIPSVTYDYDGTTKRTQKGMSVGFIFWSDGIITIPLNFQFWLRKKDAGELYRKKTDIVKELIIWTKENKVPFSEIKLDGAFASEDMLLFLTMENIGFTIRIPSNRIVTTKNCTAQLSQLPDLKLIRNQKYKTVFGVYKKIGCYFTAHKRKGKKGTHEVVFIVSSFDRIPEEQVKSYDKRWPAEKYFRTDKQHLGLTH
jgi:hypothetical protein